MKFDQLRNFLEVAKHEHVGKAAKALALSPSAVSHSIASLEDTLGNKLFERTGKHIVLSEHGKLLQERGKKLLRDIENLTEELSAPTAEAKGHYVLAATHGLCEKVLAPAWAELERTFPRLTAEILSLRSDAVIAGVLSGELDFGICCSPNHDPQLATENIYEGNVYICLNKDHPILGTSLEPTTADLSRFKAVMPKVYQGVDANEIARGFMEKGLQVRLDCVVDNYDVGVAKVLHSYSWGIFPDLIINETPQLQALTHLGAIAPYGVVALWRRERYVNKVLRLAIELGRKRLSSGYLRERAQVFRLAAGLTH